MSLWQRTLDISSAWRKAGDDEITPTQLAKVIADKLSKLDPFGPEFQYLDEARDELVESFKELADDPSCTSSEIDAAMQELYDWADSKMDDDWNGKTACWIKTSLVM